MRGEERQLGQVCNLAGNAYRCMDEYSLTTFTYGRQQVTGESDVTTLLEFALASLGTIQRMVG